MNVILVAGGYPPSPSPPLPPLLPPSIPSFPLPFSPFSLFPHPPPPPRLVLVSQLASFTHTLGRLQMVDSSLRRLSAPFRRRPTLMDCESPYLVTYPGCYGNCINIGLGPYFNIEEVIIPKERVRLYESPEK